MFNRTVNFKISHLKTLEDGNDEGSNSKMNWRGLFTNKLVDHGMALYYIPLERHDGKPIVRTKLEEIK